MLASNNGHKPSGFSGSKNIEKWKKKFFALQGVVYIVIQIHAYIIIVCKLWKDPTDKHFENKNTFSKTIINQI